MRLLLPFIVTLSLPFLATANDLEQIRPFLKSYCYECHGADKQKNDLRFDTLSTNLTDQQTLGIWQDILDQLNLGEMPPKKADLHPEAKETQDLIEQLTAILKGAYAKQKSTDRQAVLRRLNRFELRNTIRDLLYLNGPEFRVDNVSRLVDNNGNGSVANTSTNPFRHFPDDEEEHGFDNIGDRLVMSDFFLKLMITAAEESLSLATNSNPKPPVEKRHFTAPFSQKGNWSQSNPMALELAQRELKQGYDAIYRRYWRFGRMRPDDLHRGVGTSARYRITIEASANNQRHPWGEVIDTDQEEALKLGLHLVSHRSEHSSRPLQSWSIPDDGKVHRFVHETWIDAEWVPWLGWENGPNPRNVWAEPLLKQYQPEVAERAPDRKNREEWNKWIKEQSLTLLKNYRGPHLRIHSLTLEPLIDQWPPKSHTALYGTGPLSKTYIEKLLLNFASRAFRRPVTAQEIQPYLKLAQGSIGEGPQTPPVIEGLSYRAYEGQWERLPDFSKLEPTRSGDLPHGLIDLRPSQKRERFGMVFEGRLKVKRSGDHEFIMASDDGARFQINGETVIEHDGLHGAEERKGKAKLSAGDHRIRVEYFAFGQPNSFRLSWSGPGFAQAPLSVAAPKRQPNKTAEPNKALLALRTAYTAILCAPDFLYLKQEKGPLTDYQLASRLSYFLWSSMPDDQLFDLAKSGNLRKPGVIEAQVERMLKNPKAGAFTRHFTERWLRLDKLSESPPERSGPFRVYHDRRLEPQIIAQADAYFRHLVQLNGPIRDLIDSDYTFLNEPVAEIFYKRKDVRGEQFQRVPTNDPRRGGILTLPVVMTASANGVDTSPIVRGVFVLENILGTPPSPPPPDVEPLAPDLRGATTLREQLARHREVASCNNCHQKIDPMGFAFENFNPIGQWRTDYPRRTHAPRRPIDPSSTMADGTEIPDIVAFKKMLMGREKDVTRCLTEKLLTYASGRTMEPADRGEVDRIVENLTTSKGGLRDLIKLVAQSEIVLTK